MNHGTEKRCAICKQVYPVEQFYLNARGQRHSYCKPCHREYGFRRIAKQVNDRMLGA